MALKFRKVQRKILNGADKDQVKTFAVAKSSGYCDMAKLCELISSRSAMSSADVKAILDSLNWAMGLELRSGNIVQLGEFGNFRLSISSQGTVTEDEFNAARIKKARIVFFPGASLRWSNFLTTFEEDDVKVVEKKTEDNQPEDDRPVIE